MKMDSRLLVVVCVMTYVAVGLFSVSAAQPALSATVDPGPTVARPPTVVGRPPARAGDDRAPASQDESGDAFGGRIYGIVYEDLNANQAYDQGEPGVESAIVALTDSFGPPIATQRTMADGIFSFDNLPPGSYCLEEIDPPGFGSSTANKVCLPQLTEGQELRRDFGDVRLPTVTPTATPLESPTPTSTFTPGPTATPTATSTASATPTPASWMDPSEAIPAYCQGVFLGDTTDKPNRAEHYGGTPGIPWRESGPEDLYILQKTVSSDLTVSVEPLTGKDLDVFLLSAPYPEDLVEGGYGNQSFTVVNLPPGTYYIIVDGYEGAMGPYRLWVRCEGEPTPTPTPTLSPTPTNTRMFSYEPLVLRQPTPTPTNTPTPSPTPTLRPYEQGVNCGSDQAYQAYNGQRYAADRPFTVGSWGWQGGGVLDVTSTTRDIGNTDDDLLYQTQRHSLNAYYFTVPNGRYEVILRFAEVFPYTRAGDRVFAVDIEGQRVLDNFDLLGQTALYRAWDKTAYVDVVDGLLAITFTAQSAEYTPIINGILVRRVG